MSTFERVYILGLDGPDGAGKTTAIDNFFTHQLTWAAEPEVPEDDTVVGPWRVYDRQDGHALDLWVMRQTYPSWLPTGVAARRYLSGAPPLRLDHQQRLMVSDFWAGELQQYAAAKRAWRSWRQWCGTVRPLGVAAPGALLIVCDRTPLSMLAYNGAEVLRVDAERGQMSCESQLAEAQGSGIDSTYMVLSGTSNRVRLPHRVVLLLPPDEVLLERVSAKRALHGLRPGAAPGTAPGASPEHMRHNDTAAAVLPRKAAFAQVASNSKLRGLDALDIVVQTDDIRDLLHFTPWQWTTPALGAVQADTTTTTTETQEENR